MSGCRTSFGGSILEAAIRALRMKRFSVVSHDEYTTAKGDLFSGQGSRWLVKHYPYETIFGTPGRREYYIASAEWSGQLECKFQNGSGSVDEKMVYISETLRRTDERALALVYAGKYWTDKDRGASVIQWMRAEATRIRDCGKQLLVFDMDQFIEWANETWS